MSKETRRAGVRRFKKWLRRTDVVNEDGTPVPLVGNCPDCSRSWDEHCFYVRRQVVSYAYEMEFPRALKQPICPKPNERWARGPLKGDDVQNLDWLDYLIEGLETE